MRTIAVVNQKGGCGKTTVSINLASALAQLGMRVLLADMDPQSHCAVGLAVPEEQIEQSIYDVLISKSRNEPIRLSEILWKINDKLELAPASIDLSAFEQQMAGINQPENCLKSVLADVAEDYAYAIIDCPPAVSLLTFNALTAATDVIVPVETGYFALHGLSKQLETLDILCQRNNHQVNVRVLASMYDIRTKMARDVLAELRSHFAEKTLAEEVVGCEAVQQRRELVDSLAGQLDKIGATADELLKTTRDVPQKRKDRQPPIEIADVDARLSDYYGVRQINDAVVFVTLYPRAQQVQIAGDFNNWQPQQTSMENVDGTGAWKTKLNLPAGKYRYRLVVDGHWQQDPYNEMTEANPFGEADSILIVK